MRSFVVTTAAPTNVVTLGPIDWGELAALGCRACTEEKGLQAPGTEFIPDVELKVGLKLSCPYCGVQSVVPKKARWS